MNKTIEMSDSDLIDFYYSSAVKGIKEKWFKKVNSKWYEYIISLPNKERVVYLLALLDDEVNNGGFNQYFINGYGQFAKETIDDLKLIKAFNLAEILSKAFSEINKEGLKDKVFRKKLLLGEISRLYDDDTLDDYLEELDDKYYQSDDDLGKLLIEYLRSDNVPE